MEGSLCSRAYLCFHSGLASLSCLLICSASDSAPIFFFALPKKKTVAGGQKKKGALYGLDKGSIQQHFQRTAGAYRASSEGLCALPDARPLTLAVCAAWRCHCRVHSVRLNGEKAENLLLCRVEQPETLPCLRDCQDQRLSVRGGTKDL